MSKITNIKKDIPRSYSYARINIPDLLCIFYCYDQHCNSNECIIHKALPKLYMEDIR